MNIIERAISVVAPHECIGCDKEDTLLCEVCQIGIVGTVPSRCYRCHAITKQFQVCANCRRKVAPRHAWIACEYDGLAKLLVHKLKFERAKAGASVIAKILDDMLPILPKDTVVTYVPTTSARVRVRGYDQSKLIAKELAFRKGLVFDELLIRVSSSRQVGAGRQTRFQQLESAFEPRKKQGIKGQTVLLIDDVLTTGASIESASRVLVDAGAKKVEVAVFAH